MAQISAILQDWREQDKLPFPDHSAAEKEAFKASLNYPPQGSPG